MSLIDVSEHDDFHYAYKDLAYQMLEQNATDDEVTETLKEIIDEFMVTKEEPDEENPEGYGRIYDTGEPDNLSTKVVQIGWKRWAPVIISYVKKYYLEELEELHGATIGDFEKQLISGMAAGVSEWDSQEATVEPPLIPADDPILKQLKGALASADSSR